MARFHHELLRRLRLDLGMSQEDAARSLGIDARTYRRYESGEVNEGGPFGVRGVARRTLLRKMCDLLGVEREQDFLVEETPAPRRRGHALLRAAHLVGREELLAKVSRFCHEGSGLLAVIAVGGAGKTALVERATADLSDVFIHSFYDDPHTEAAVEALQDGSFPVVVLDGLESVQSEGGEGRAFGEIEDPALRSALRTVAARGRPRVLVTSRLPLTDLAAWSSVQTIALPPLTGEASLALLRACGLVGDDRTLSELYARTGGHALSVAMFGSYVAHVFGGDPARAHLVDLQQAGEDDPIARRLSSLLSAYERALRPSERSLLALLSLFSGAADSALLAEVSQLAEADLARSLARLARYGLLERGPSGISAHPFVREHFRGLLVSGERSAHEALCRALEARLGGRPKAPVEAPEQLDAVEQLLEHTRAAGRPIEAWGVYLRALGGFDHLGLRLGAMVRGQRVLSRFARGSDPDRLDASLSGEIGARLLYDWALYAVALGDLPLVRRCHRAHQRSLDGVQPDVSRNLRVMGLRTWAHAEWLAGDIDAARARLETSTALLRPDDPPFHRVRNLALSAMIASDEGLCAKALLLLEEARSLEPTLTARRALWAAEILYEARQAEPARALVEQATADCERRGWRGHVAHGAVLQGTLCLPGDPEGARLSLARAERWARASGEIEMQLRCHQLALALARATGDEEMAERQRHLGEILAVGQGMMRFLRYFSR